jgi:hypothetical protein
MARVYVLHENEAWVAPLHAARSSRVAPEAPEISTANLPNFHMRGLTRSVLSPNETSPINPRVDSVRV